MAEMRCYDRDATRGPLEVQRGLGSVPEHGFFNKKDAKLSGEARHQVLRPLEDQLPAQMGKTEQIAYIILRMTMSDFLV
jgi:hypothetical protein